MNILEKEIEDIICESLSQDPEILRQRGLHLHPHFIRQLDLGSYGKADIVSFRKSRRYIEIQIVELKKDAIDAAAFWQAVRYAKGLQRILREDYDTSNHMLDFEIILIGKKIECSTDIIFLPDFLGVYLFTYSIDMILGIQFKPHRNYHQANEMRGAFTKENINYLKQKLFNKQVTPCL